MTRLSRWHEGFYEGVCSTLSVLAAHDDGSVEFREIVRQCGGADLLAYAERKEESTAPAIRRALTGAPQR